MKMRILYYFLWPVRNAAFAVWEKNDGLATYCGEKAVAAIDRDDARMADEWINEQEAFNNTKSIAQFVVNMCEALLKRSLTG